MKFYTPTSSQHNEQSNEQSRHADSWTFINNVTGRMTPTSWKIKASSKEDSVSKWYEHFNKLPDDRQERETISV